MNENFFVCLYMVWEIEWATYLAMSWFFRSRNFCIFFCSWILKTSRWVFDIYWKIFRHFVQKFFHFIQQFFHFFRKIFNLFSIFHFIQQFSLNSQLSTFRKSVFRSLELEQLLIQFWYNMWTFLCIHKTIQFSIGAWLIRPWEKLW